MGVGADNVLDRMAASVGELTAVEPVFQAVSDVPNGGVLFALPALLAIGLLHQAHKYFQLPKGYYGLESLFLMLAFLALARLPSLEQLRYCAPGEWGKLLGLDRIPEVRTVRKKLALLSEQEQASSWSAELCAQWMGEDPDKAAVLYVDGHVRVYHGHQTQLPRHYVARQKLCLRATTDYWVNAMDGQPFFLLNQAVDPGMLQVLEHEIVPRLEREIPNQPTPEQLAGDAKLHRFTLVFDREGYSPVFLRTLKKKRIACLTYHKYPGEDWPSEEFVPCRVQLSHRAPVWTCAWPSAAPSLGVRSGCAKSANAPKAAIRPRCCRPITVRIRGRWPRPCSLDGRRKTSSNTCGNTMDWTVWSTMLPRRFPIPQGW